MSLHISRVSRLIRLNAASQVEKRACICSTATLQENEANTSDGSSSDKTIKLVGTPEVPKYIEKKVMISRAMQLFIQNKRKEDEIKQKHISEIKLGQRHLANIMGVDVNDLMPGDVKRALQYILPSGLHSKKARPSMELPSNMVIEPADIKMVETGRPSHYLYYTLKPSYFQLMHEMAMLLEEIRDEQAALQQKRKSLTPSTPEEAKEMEAFNRLVNQTFISFSALKKGFTEPVSEADEKKFYTLLERIISQPLAYKRKEFFDRFPRPENFASEQRIKRELQFNADGNRVAHAEGGRKTIKAKVKVTDKGSGNLTINNEDILFFDDIIHREAVLFPLKFLGLLGKYDIEASVTSSTVVGQNCQSAQAGALRLAISRAIVNFVTDEDVFRLEKAGLLTRDPRMRERKKPGKTGARKKYTWKAR